jgi:GAF domain-containing protein
VPAAGVTFIDKDRQSMASTIGLDAGDIPRSDAFCDITIRRPQHFVIEDTLLDPRYARNPVVINPPHIRFYAGYPIEATDGQRIGALCIMDRRPRHFSETDAALLRDLAQRAQNRLWALSEEGPVPMS